MFREFREVSEEKNIDGVERFKDEYVVDIEEVMNILKSLGKQDVVSELASQDLSQFDRKFVKKEFKDGKYALFQKNKEGERHGQYFQFYPSGQLDTIIPYQNGLNEGTAKKYAEEGYLEAETAYHKGLRNGIFTQYHTDGKTPSQIAEEYDGVARKSTYYRRDGSKLSEMNFEDGKPVGLRRIFKKDGKTVAKEVPYSGTLKSFGLNGKKISEVKYIDGVPEHETKGKLTSLFKELSEQKQEVVGGKIQEKTQEPTQQQSHVKEPEPQPKQGPQPQMPNWEIVGVGKTEILADSKEAFKKARQDKREAAQQANKKTSPKPQAPNQEEQKLRDFAAWEKEVEEAIAKAVAEWRERTKANVSDEEKVKTEQEAQQKPQPPRTPNTSQEYSYDLNFNSSRDVHLGQNGAMKIDFSTPAPKPNVPNRQTTDMQQTVQSNGQKQPISYMKKQFFNKGGSR